MSSYEKMSYRALLRRILGQGSTAHRTPSVVKNIQIWLADIQVPCHFSAGSYYVSIDSNQVEYAIDELRKRFYKTYISQRMFYEQAKAKMYVLPTNFEILINSSKTIAQESFSIFHGNRKSYTQYINANTLSDFLAEYKQNYSIRVNVPLLCEQNSKPHKNKYEQDLTYCASPFSFIGGVDKVAEGRETPSDLTVPTFSVSSDTINQYVESQLAPFVDPDSYCPMDEKSKTLHRLINTFIERHKDLYEQQNLLAPDPNREGRIKSIIMNLVYVLQTQKEYIKRCFDIDIDVIVQKYNNGQWMSDIELEKFFNMNSKRRLIVAHAFAKTKQKGC